MIPSPARWMIRLSLIWLLISALAGGILLSHKALFLHPATWALLPVHYELAIWGWMVQFVIGTAYWIFPKKLEDMRRGPVIPAWVMVFFYNTGVLLLAASGFIETVAGIALSGRLLILIALLLFAWLIWQRVVTYRNR